MDGSALITGCCLRWGCPGNRGGGYRRKRLVLRCAEKQAIAEKHGGPTSLDNLAWACLYYNRFKGSDLASIDPASSKLSFSFTHEPRNGIVIFA